MVLKHWLQGGVLALSAMGIAHAGGDAHKWEGPLTAEEAARLGTELTPMGAIREGNASGTIPAWTGGLTEPPAGFVPGGDYINPFADEEPLYVITAANMHEYAEHLMPGTKALLERFPDTYKVPVYPSHRTAANPQFVYDDIKRDSQHIQLVDGGNGINNVGKGRLHFPIPKTGIEVIWNLGSKYFGDQITMAYHSFPVQRNGSYTPVHAQQQRAWTPVMEGADAEYGIKVFYEMFSPRSNAGYKIVTHEPFNFDVQPRQTWVYNPGQRRVLRAPEVSYDTPIAGSDGLVTNDATDCFVGGKDRYDWTLVGKKEYIIPYNNYDLNSLDRTASEIVGASHINPDLMRYEMKRVWVVDGKLAEGKRNVFGSRRYYFDEDSALCVGGELYDMRGDLWRVIVSSMIQMYDVPMPMMRLEAHYDLQARRYMVQYLANDIGPYQVGEQGFQPGDFTVSTLRRAGR